MNGNRTAEQWAEAANRAAQVATTKAQTATNAAMEAKQSVAFIEREVGDLRKEMNDGFGEVSKELRALKAMGPYRAPARSQQLSLTHEDFEETPTGSYKITRDTYSNKVMADAKKWRAMWRRVRWAVWIGLGAALVKLAELGIERMFHK